ncbi:MAG: hypothetical protein [Olavius algarvensis Gamma 1 endosymbiont]|nr:MAG: hypothetical protein [Olavius algarvensis Gamma 1 endosymbiont]
MTGASENPGMSAHKIRERKRLHLRINSGNKKLRITRMRNHEGRHESTRIKKRGSTENTKDTKKNKILPSVFFRAFRGQKKVTVQKQVKHLLDDCSLHPIQK